MADPAKRVSKFLSLVLRHRPELIGVELDPGGWVDVEVLLAGAREKGHDLSCGQLDEIVASSDKQRFTFSEDGSRIRANQGHSVDVELGLKPVTPPDVLYHGTVASALPSIKQHGIQKRSRHHVHLSADTGTATVVGARRGEAVILTIDAAAMAAVGHEFFVSKNGVWLADQVPAEFVGFP